MTTEDEDYPYFVTVEIPKEASQAEVEAIFDAVADAAYEAQPEKRNWDIFVHGQMPR